MEIEKIKEQLSHVLAVIEPAYVDAILMLHKRLDKDHVTWAVGGDLGEALKTVQAQPDCLEIVTDRNGAAQIFLAFKGVVRKGVYFQTQRLNRNAMLGGKEYPVYARSYYFDFTICGVKVKVHGNLQYRVSDWEWGDKLEFTPEYVSVTGTRTAIVPLQVKYDIYQGLGWTDRAEKVSQILNRHPYALR